MHELDAQASSSISHSEIKLVAFAEFITIDNNHFKRRKGTQKWVPVESIPLAVPRQLPGAGKFPDPTFVRSDFFTLYLLRQNQYPEEPLHWALIVTPTEEFACLRKESVSSFDNNLYCTYIFQVRGDAEGMKYEPERVFKPLSLLDYLHSTFEIGTIGYDDLKTVTQVAEREEPPRARNRREATENCQAWSIRVLEKLVDLELIKKEKSDMLRAMVEPL
ncbi:hypothetical protein EJ04DRAFT_576356 [Polyplosphaeria fusca]|uniref:Uncharacterized protein n=1 Tax=Polyplosphaeria fusca TaxID=682080 RepID=A0A9P4R1J4_9PLEO|nr:hypothetical protein EJ04DRAFT_576356 [Polyplosphaeria fusca]